MFPLEPERTPSLFFHLLSLPPGDFSLGGVRIHLLGSRPPRASACAFLVYLRLWTISGVGETRLFAEHPGGHWFQFSYLSLARGSLRPETTVNVGITLIVGRTTELQPLLGTLESCLQLEEG